MSKGNRIKGTFNPVNGCRMGTGAGHRMDVLLKRYNTEMFRKEREANGDFSGIVTKATFSTKLRKLTKTQRKVDKRDSRNETDPKYAALCEKTLSGSAKMVGLIMTSYTFA